jgi:hypothetical protein
MVRAGPVVLCLVLAVSACGRAPSGDGLRYAQPAPRGALPEVALPGTSASETLAFAATRLRAAGFDAVRTDVRGARVTAQSSDPALVDCGTFTQTAFGNTARFPGNAPQSVLFAPGVPGRIVTRSTLASTEVTVTLQGPGRASVATVHDVRARQSPVIAGQSWRDRVRFDGDGTGAVADRVVCTGSRAVLGALSGP